jgi:hypothetical protein
MVARLKRAPLPTLATTDNMQELLDELAALRSECAVHANRLCQKFGLAEDAAPIGALSICFNNVTLVLELSWYYKTQWAAPAPAHLTEKLRNENAERLAMVGRFLFINTISACEFQAKNGNRQFPLILELSQNRPYLSNILHQSRIRGLLTEDVKLLWDGAIRIRNCLVHNNAVADETAQWTFGPDLTVALQDGEMTQGTIMMMPRLTKWVVRAYADWCDAFLTRTR